MGEDHKPSTHNQDMRHAMKIVDRRKGPPLYAVEQRRKGERRWSVIVQTITASRDGSAADAQRYIDIYHNVNFNYRHVRIR